MEADPDISLRVIVERGGEWWLFLGERIGFQSNLYLKEKSNDTKV
jgi:hypothetical protein